MKTNSFFNLNRFVALARQDLMLNKNKYWLTLAVAIGAIYLALVYQMQNSPMGFTFPIYKMVNSRLPGWGYADQFMVTLFGLGAFIGVAFSNFGNKAKTTNLLMLPASTFEKFAYPFVFRVLFGLLLTILIYWMDAKLAGWSLAESKTFVENNYIIVPFQFPMYFDLPGNLNGNLLILFSVISIGMYLYVVPLFFKKQALIKTILSFFALILAYATCLVLYSHLFNPETKGFDITLKEFNVTDQMDSNILMFHILIDVAWIFLLFLGYFKLKEKRL
jgi:hypothetical protein